MVSAKTSEGKEIIWNVKSTLQRVVPTVVGSTSNAAKAERQWNKKAMTNRFYLFAVVLPMLSFAGVASAQQYPIIDQIANRVVQKYQNSSCEQLWQKRGEPKSPREQEAVQALRNDPQMRAVFIDRVAAPIANKMFECGGVSDTNGNAQS